MKIALIHGQNHHGSTYHIARMTADKIGGEVTEFFLPHDFGAGCSGCLTCLHEGREYCPRAEKVAPIFDAMLAADLIILSSPTYVMEMTSHLKGFLEHIFTAWLVHRPEDAMFSKIGIVVSTAAGLGMDGVTKDMAKQLTYLGVPKVYRMPFRVLASDWAGVSDKIKTKIEATTSRIARKIIARQGQAGPGLKTRMLFSGIRSFQKDNDYAPLDKAYWEAKGWLRKERPWRKENLSKKV